MLDGVEGLGRVRLDEKAGEKLDEFEEKFNIRQRGALVGQNCGQLSLSGQIPRLNFFIFCQICHVSSKSDIFLLLPNLTFFAFSKSDIFLQVHREL